MSTKLLRRRLMGALVRRTTVSLPVLVLGCLLAAYSLEAQTPNTFPASGLGISVARDLPRDSTKTLPPRNWIDQTLEEAAHKSRGCFECHAGSEPMHTSKNVVLGCTDCHGGNATPGLTQRKAHVSPCNPVFWES